MLLQRNCDSAYEHSNSLSPLLSEGLSQSYADQLIKPQRETLTAVCFFLLSVFDCLRSELGDDAVLLEALIQGETLTCLNCYDQSVTRSSVKPILSLPIQGQAIHEAIIDCKKINVG